MNDRLLFDGAVDLAIAGAYVWAGRRFQHRSITGPSRAAGLAFTTWWYALSLTGLFAGLLSLAVWAGVGSLPVARTLTHLTTAAFVIAMWGLLRYLVYVLTGRLGGGLLFALVYVGYYALLVYDGARSVPVGIDATGWRPVFVYTTDPKPTITAVISVLLVVPQVVASLAYIGLVFRIKDRMVRYRIALVGPTLIIWSASVLFISRPELAPSDLVQVASRLLILLTAGALFFAYAPPAFISRRLDRDQAG